jgi:hypothetical protein
VTIFRRVVFGRIGAALMLLTLCAACRPRHRAHEGHARRLTPLAASSWLVDLPVPGFGVAKVAVPLAAGEPRPSVIALHGLADRPEWACAAWRAIAGPRPFVICPRGQARSDFPASDARFSFGNVEETKAELRAALHALKDRFGAHVAPGSVVIAGFELGADQAAEIAREEPEFFSRVVLAEGTPGAWSTSLAAVFFARGGKKVLFACASQACRADAELKVTLARRSGADGRLVFAGELGPTFDSRVTRPLKGEWPWLVRGEEGWARH